MGGSVSGMPVHYHIPNHVSMGHSLGGMRGGAPAQLCTRGYVRRADEVGVGRSGEVIPRQGSNPGAYHLPVGLKRNTRRDAYTTGTCALT